ncbi:hypothetical protein GC174_10325 [bacterium]|nr:hypothetical protein [bacterium]
MTDTRQIEKSAAGGGKGSDDDTKDVIAEVSRQQFDAPKAETPAGDTNAKPETKSEDESEAGAETLAPVDAGTVSDRLSRESLDADALSILKGNNGDATGDGKTALPGLQIAGADQASRLAAPESVPEQHLSGKELQKIAEAIDKAANGGFLGIGTDKEAINEQLRRLKTPEERETLDKLYKIRTGMSIQDELNDELSGSDLARSTALWKGQNDTAARLNTALLEHGEYWGARSNANVEKDIRISLSTLTSDQVKEEMTRFEERYGKSFQETIANNPDISRATREAVDIYLEGTDKRTDADTGKLAQTALEARNPDMFQEVFSTASSGARAEFMKNEGADKILKAFGTPYATEYDTEVNYLPNEDTRHALDYARGGGLELATKIEANTGILMDNEDAIELALDGMSKSERASYLHGRELSDKSKSESGTGTESELSASDKQDLEYFEKIRKALEGAGNDRELAVWEDRIAHGKDGSLVTKLAAHGGIFDDGMNDVLGTIEDMSEQDWKRLKEDRDFYKEVTGVLKIDLSKSEMTRAEALLKAKMEAGDYDSSKMARREVFDALADSRGGEEVLANLKKMTPEEKERYRTDKEFRELLDRKVRRSVFHPAHRQAADSIMETINQGEPPENDIVAKIFMYSAKGDRDAREVVVDLKEAIQKDPAIVEAYRTDPEYRRKFDDALRSALLPADRDKYIKPLLNGERLPFQTQAQLYDRIIDDRDGLYDAIKRGTEEDWKEIVADPDKVLGFLGEDYREIAVNIAKQGGKLQPEDEMRIAMLGLGTDEAALKRLARDLTPEIARAFVEKYDADALGDMLDETGGSDKREIILEARPDPKNSTELLFDVLDRTTSSVDGIGEAMADGVDGTGDMSKDLLHRLAASVADSNKGGKALTEEELASIEQQFKEGIKLYGESEEFAANTAIDAGLITLAVATGGVGSIAAAAYWTAGGALAKVGTKAIIMGEDYDFGSADVVTDLATGAIDTGVGTAPQFVARALGIGRATSQTATRAILASADEVSLAGGKQLLKEGAEEVLERGIMDQITVAIANNTGEVGEQAIKNLATRVTASADDIDNVTRLIQKHITEAAQLESGNAIKASLRQYALNTASAEVGGVSSAAIYNIDSEAGFDTVLMTAGIAGLAGIGGTFIGRSFSRGSGAADNLVAGRHADDLIPEAAADDILQAASGRPARDVLEGRTEIPTARGKIEIDYHGDGPLDGQIKHLSSAEGVNYSSADGRTWTVSDANAPGGKVEVKGRLEVHEDGGIAFTPDGGNTVIATADGKHIEINKFSGEAREVAAERMLRDVDGRPYGKRAGAIDRFEHLNPAERAASVQEVADDLSKVKAIGPDGKPVSVYDSLMGDPTLSQAQKENILHNLSEVREHFAAYRQGDRMHPDPEVNWIHTQGELGKVMESARANNLTADQMEDAMLASMYSDSVKFAFPPPEGANANFFTHHLEGALAADEMLSRQGFPRERIDRIVQVIKEHQIAPPEFMGLLYHGQIKRGLDAQLANNAITVEKHGQMMEVLDSMTVKKEVAPGVELSYVGKIANVNDAPLVRNADGSYEVMFTPQERELMQLAGVEGWSVPKNPQLDSGFEALPKAEQERLISQYKISRALIDGDGIDNYTTLGGASKIVTIRGPETMFQDATVWKSVDSVDQSFRDAYNVMTPEGQRLANQSLASRNQVLHDTENGVKAQMDQWLRSRGLDPDSQDIPYYNKPLKYPERLTPQQTEELNRLSAMNKPGAAGVDASTPEARASRDARIRELKYNGLSEEEIKQFEFAKEIRSQMADMMRREHRTDGSLPGNFDNTRMRLRELGEAGSDALGEHAEIIGARGGDGKLWYPERDLRKLTTAERMQVKEILEGKVSPLATRDSVDGFVKDMVPIVKGFKDDMAPQMKHVEELRASYEEKVGAYMLARDTSDFPLNQYTAPDFEARFREFVKDDPQRLKALNDYVLARDTYARELTGFNEAVEGRVQQIQDVLDRYADSHDLPRVKLKHRPQRDMASAGATYSDGQITVTTEALLNDRQAANLIGSTLHEMTHNEQNKIAVWGVIDSLGGNPSVKEIQDVFQGFTGRFVSEDYVNQVVALRNGAELSPRDAGRLYEILGSLRANAPVDKEWSELGNSFRVVNRDLLKLTGDTEPSAAFRILSEMASKPGKFEKHLFEGPVPAELKPYTDRIRAFNRGVDDAWTQETEREARQVLRRYYEGRTEKINARREQLYDAYMQFHEVDAWYVGERARLAARSAGAPDSSDLIIDGINWAL